MIGQGGITVANATRFVSDTTVIVGSVAECVNDFCRFTQTIDRIGASGVIRGVAAVVCAIFWAFAG